MRSRITFLSRRRHRRRRRRRRRRQRLAFPYFYALITGAEYLFTALITIITPRALVATRLFISCYSTALYLAHRIRVHIITTIKLLLLFYHPSLCRVNR